MSSWSLRSLKKNCQQWQQLNGHITATISAIETIATIAIAGPGSGCIPRSPHCTTHEKDHQYLRMNIISTPEELGLNRKWMKCPWWILHAFTGTDDLPHGYWVSSQVLRVHLKSTDDFPHRYIISSRVLRILVVTEGSLFRLSSNHFFFLFLMFVFLVSVHKQAWIDKFHDHVT